MPFAQIRSFIYLSRATMLRARCSPYSKAAVSRRAGIEPDCNQPAAIASSGFRSIIQSASAPPFRRTETAARKEISGGDVIATTESNLDIHNRAKQQLAK